MDLVKTLEKLVRLESLIKKSHDPDVKNMLRVEYKRLGDAAREMQHKLANGRS